MGKRSGVPETEEAVAKLSLAELHAEIARCLWGAENGGTSQGRKAFFKRLVWLETMREKRRNATAQQHHVAPSDRDRQRASERTSSARRLRF
jgi:hypothetical protein